MKRSTGSTHLGAELSCERRRHRFEHRDVAVAALRRCGDFGADETSTNYDNTTARLQFGPKSQTVVERAYNMEVGTRGLPRKGTNTSAGCDHELIEPEITRCRTKNSRRDIETVCARTVAKFDVDVGKIATRSQLHAGRLPVTSEHLLRQRRTVVGETGFVGDDRDRPREAATAKRFGGSKPAERATDDRDANPVQ